ncbi:MAG TPA: PEP/pyruvate-binding domain-containing protein [Solirubrobacteraceae bacterium]|nr:PEP/pyruvate-binding domain-containing protein [Solirubrobacteraceae bacterium]
MSVVSLSRELDLGREQLGGKAWSITEMLRHGIPVPPAFTITTDECSRYYEDGRSVPADVLAALPDAVAALEAATGGTFGAGPRPLLVSVRSGAPTSMPGMMDTVLNLGMTDAVQEALREIGGAEYAADTRRRFVEQFTKVVGSEPPSDPWDQLRAAIAAVFDSWQSDRAVAYRAEREISGHGGTAVTVQAMVFGNLDDVSGTGVLFSRDPTGASEEHYGEWLPRGQGEDVVSGAFDPLPVEAMAEALPDAYDELLAVARRLDAAAGVAQDIEFTVECGKLWLLQCRRAKVLQATGPHVDDEARAGAVVLASGRPACPGIVSGVVVCDVDDAETRALEGEDVILARPTTNPHEVAAMAVVRGILTEIGGATSHAAVVSRELGVPCVVGCGAGALTELDGQIVTVDATTGEVLEGALPVVEA